MKDHLSVMNYTVAFDVLKNGYQWHSFHFINLLIIFLGTRSLLANKYSGPPNVQRFWAIFSWSCFGLMLFGFSSICLFSFVDYRHLASALRSDRCQVIEGRVTEFDPMPWSGHKNEAFTVDGRRFTYSDFGVTAGFNNTRSHGGPIRDGVFVRIHHVGNEIARLEIAG